MNHPRLVAQGQQELRVEPRQALWDLARVEAPGLADQAGQPPRPGLCPLGPASKQHFMVAFVSVIVFVVAVAFAKAVVC